MKLRVFDRILLALLLIITIVASFAVLGVATRLIPQPMVAGFISLFYDNFGNTCILAGAALLVLIISIRLVFAGKREPREGDEAAVMCSDEMGGTYVALSALDGMVKKHCSAYERICACRSTLKAGPDGLGIRLKLAVLPDTNVAEMSRVLQTTLKEYVQGLTGIQIHEIRILVENATEAQIKAAPVPTSDAFTMPTAPAVTVAAVQVTPEPAVAAPIQQCPAEPVAEAEATPEGEQE